MTQVRVADGHNTVVDVVWYDSKTGAIQYNGAGGTAVSNINYVIPEDRSKLTGIATTTIAAPAAGGGVLSVYADAKPGNVVTVTNAQTGEAGQIVVTAANQAAINAGSQQAVNEALTAATAPPTIASSTPSIGPYTEFQGSESDPTAIKGPNGEWYSKVGPGLYKGSKGVMINTDSFQGKYIRCGTTADWDRARAANGYAMVIIPMWAGLSPNRVDGFPLGSTNYMRPVIWKRYQSGDYDPINNCFVGVAPLRDGQTLMPAEPVLGADGKYTYRTDATTDITEPSHQNTSGTDSSATTHSDATGYSTSGSGNPLATILQLAIRVGTALWQAIQRIH